MHRPRAFQPPGSLPAMILIGLLFVLSDAGIIHSLLATFAG